MPIKGTPPSQEQINEAKALFYKKLEAEPPAVPFHPSDLARIKDNDVWMAQLLESYDHDYDKTLSRLFANLEWRQSFGVNDINESNINQEYFKDGQIYVHNKDKDGKPLLIINMLKHSKSQNIDDLLRIVVYWVERVQRDPYLGKITIFMDMTDTGLSNVDMDFVKRIVQLFEMSYPSAPNYILVHELPFLLNAAFKVVKGFLPAKAQDILRVISKKDINEYIDMDNCLTSWGGNDNYQFSA